MIFKEERVGGQARGKVFRIGTVRYRWPMSAHASQAFSIASCTDSEDLPARVTIDEERVVSVTRLNRNRVKEILRLAGCENLITLQRIKWSRNMAENFNILSRVHVLHERYRHTTDRQTDVQCHVIVFVFWKCSLAAP